MSGGDKRAIVSTSNPVAPFLSINPIPVEQGRYPYLDILNAKIAAYNEQVRIVNARSRPINHFVLKRKDSPQLKKAKLDASALLQEICFMITEKRALPYKPHSDYRVADQECINILKDWEVTSRVGLHVHQHTLGAKKFVQPNYGLEQYNFYCMGSKNLAKSLVDIDADSYSPMISMAIENVRKMGAPSIALESTHDAQTYYHLLKILSRQILLELSEPLSESGSASLRLLLRCVNEALHYFIINNKEAKDRKEAYDKFCRLFSEIFYNDIEASNLKKVPSIINVFKSKKYDPPETKEEAFSRKLLRQPNVTIAELENRIPTLVSESIDTMLISLNSSNNYVWLLSDRDNPMDAFIISLPTANANDTATTFFKNTAIHTYLVEPYFSFGASSDGFSYYHLHITDFFPEGDLAAYSVKLKEENASQEVRQFEAVKFIRQWAQCASLLYELEGFHSDIKLTNGIKSGDKLFFIDTKGLQHVPGVDLTKVPRKLFSSAVTGEYTPPEFTAKDSTIEFFDIQAYMVYEIGAALYAFVMGYGDDDRWIKGYQQVVYGDPDKAISYFPENVFGGIAGKRLKELCVHCMHPDLTCRPSLESFLLTIRDIEKELCPKSSVLSTAPSSSSSSSSPASFFYSKPELEHQRNIQTLLDAVMKYHQRKPETISINEYNQIVLMLRQLLNKAISNPQQAIEHLDGVCERIEKALAAEKDESREQKGKGKATISEEKRHIDECVARIRMALNEEAAASSSAPSLPTSTSELEDLPAEPGSPSRPPSSKKG